MKKVIVILGPTGVGKTNLSIQVAKMIQGEIISGDSVQVYRGLDIGSAKIKEEEKEGILHHLLDIKDIGEPFSVALFQRLVREKISEIPHPIICGGTGLYIDAAIRDYTFDETIRDEAFEQKYSSLNNEALYQLLIEKDPLSKDIEPNNRKRVLRALEVMEKTNHSIKENNQGHKLVYDCLILGLEMDRSILYDRINERVIRMVEEGLIMEVKNLYLKGLKVEAIGYKELYPYFRGEITLNDAILEIQKNSRHYAKKQLTWFKHDQDIIEVDMGKPDAMKQALAYVKKFMEEE